MIRDAASSRTCSGASAGGPSDGSPQIHPACPGPGPHSAAAGSSAPATSVSLTPPVFTHSYFYVKSFDLEVSPPSANAVRRRRRPVAAGAPPPWARRRLGQPASSGAPPRVTAVTPDAPVPRRRPLTHSYSVDAAFMLLELTALSSWAPWSGALWAQEALQSLPHHLCRSQT